MGKRPLIIIKENDLTFMADYAKKHNIKKHDMQDTPPPYEEYDAEVCVTSDEDDKFKGASFLTKYRFKTLPDVKDGVHKAKVFARFYIQDKEVKSCNVTFSWSIARTQEEFMKLEDHSRELSGLVKMWELLGMSGDRLEKLKKEYIESITPVLAADIIECSKDIKKEDIKQEVQQTIHLVLDLHCQIMMFLAYFKPEVAKYAKRQQSTSLPQQHSSNSKKKKKKKQANAGILTIIPMEKFVQDVQSGNLKLPRRKCPYAFQVRGHWREYKSGKRVWIKEFTKGDTTKKKKKQVVVLGKRKEEDTK